ncbi:hypothetical protein LCGC14_2604110, partial [marine sediment metagenome]
IEALTNGINFYFRNGNTTMLQMTETASTMRSSGTEVASWHVGGLKTEGDLVFEGSTADGFELTLSVTDPTADRAVLLPDAAGTVPLHDGTPGANEYARFTGTDVMEGRTAANVLSDIAAESATSDDFDPDRLACDATDDNLVDQDCLEGFMASADPKIILKVSDATAGDDNFTLDVNATDTGDGTEDIDLTLSSQIAGINTTYFNMDASAGTLALGHANAAVVLVDGATATTQSASDNSTKVATTAYADAAGGGSFDPGTDVSLIEEFMGGTTNAGTIGAGGLYPRLVGGGTANYNSVIQTAAHPGLFRLNSHATTDNSGAILVWTNIGTQEIDDWETTDWAMDAILQFGSVGAITDSWFVFGITTSVTAIYHQNMIFIRRDTDASDSVFTFVVCDTSVCNSDADATNGRQIDSTITPTATNWYRFRVRHAVSGVGGNPTVYMRVNDETELTFCSSGCDETLET